MTQIIIGNCTRVYRVVRIDAKRRTVAGTVRTTYIASLIVRFRRVGIAVRTSFATNRFTVGIHIYTQGETSRGNPDDTS